jgi:hypothetical protein
MIQRRGNVCIPVHINGTQLAQVMPWIDFTLFTFPMLLSLFATSREMMWKISSIFLPYCYPENYWFIGGFFWHINELDSDNPPGLFRLDPATFCKARAVGRFRLDTTDIFYWRRYYRGFSQTMRQK